MSTKRQDIYETSFDHFTRTHGPRVFGIPNTPLARVQLRAIYVLPWSTEIEIASPILATATLYAVAGRLLCKGPEQSWAPQHICTINILYIPMITSSAKSLAGESTTSHVCLGVVSIRSCIHYLSSPLYGKCRICQVSEERCGPIANQIPVSKSQPPISFAGILNNMIKDTFNGARRPCMDWISYFSETAYSGWTCNYWRSPRNFSVFQKSDEHAPLINNFFDPIRSTDPP